MKATEYNKLVRSCAKLCMATNVNNEEFICKTNLVRIAAISDSYILTSAYGKSGDGVFLAAGQVEYFAVNTNDTLYIKGEANISSIYPAN